MSHGFMGMTQKLRCSHHHSGDIHHPQGQKKARQVHSNVKVRVTVFFDSCKTNLTHYQRLLTPCRPPTTLVTPCVANDQSCGHGNNMAAPSWQCYCPFFTSDSDMVKQPSSDFCFSQKGSLQFVAVLQAKNAAERNLIWVVEHNIPA